MVCCKCSNMANGGRYAQNMVLGRWLLDKLTGHMDLNVIDTLGFQTLSDYLSKRHNLTLSKLDKIHLISLQSYICQLKSTTRFSTVKLIHGWLPTYGSLCGQGRRSDPIWPRCQATTETPEHFLICQHPMAVSKRHDLLNIFLHNLNLIDTPVCLSNVFAYKLALTLQIQIPIIQTQLPPLPNEQKITIFTAIRHQHLIGWDILFTENATVYIS